MTAMNHALAVPLAPPRLPRLQRALAWSRSHEQLALMLEKLLHKQPLSEPYELIEAIRGYVLPLR